MRRAWGSRSIARAWGATVPRPGTCPPATSNSAGVGEPAGCAFRPSVGWVHTGAGEPRQSGRPPASPRVHPRGREGHLGFDTDPVRNLGSIPAGAGELTAVADDSVGDGVHPHGRGRASGCAFRPPVGWVHTGVEEPAAGAGVVLGRRGPCLRAWGNQRADVPAAGRPGPSQRAWGRRQMATGFPPTAASIRTGATFQDPTAE